jgi:hypothetical protein
MMFLTHLKKPWFLSVACCFLFLISACGDTPSGQSASTHQADVAPTATSSVATPAPRTSCPGHPVVMSALATGTHPDIIYLSERGGLQTSMTAAQLIRYDTVTKSKTILLSFAQTGEGITEAQISTNGQWILFLATSLSENQARLQLIRIDGQMLQTLLCTPAYQISNIRWSPDSQHVAFAMSTPNGQVTAIHVLDLATAQQKVFTVNNYRPYAWLDNTRLYVIQPQGTLLTSQQNLALLDTSQENTQSIRFTPIASANALCGTFEKSIDGTQLFTSSCTPVNANGCQGTATQGPSTLSALPAAGGLSTTIYHSQDQAIMTLHPISSQTLLMYVENTSGNLSQNGLWKIDTDGSDLTRLSTAAGRQCSDLGYPALYPQIASSGQYYVLRVTDSTSQQESLLVGSLNGGAPTIFETKDTNEGVLILVGVVMR